MESDTETHSEKMSPGVNNALTLRLWAHEVETSGVEWNVSATITIISMTFRC